MENTVAGEGARGNSQSKHPAGAPCSRPGWEGKESLELDDMCTHSLDIRNDELRSWLDLQHHEFAH